MLASTARPDDLTVFQLALNSAPAKMLNGETAFEVFLGSHCVVFASVLLQLIDGVNIRNIDLERARSLTEIERAQNALPNYH